MQFDQDEVQAALMKTYPLKRDDGQIFAFEIPAAGLWTGSLARLLRQAPGVANVRRIWSQMDRLSFEVNGEPFLVWEFWGSSSRYCVCPVDTDVTSGNAAALEAYLRQASAWFEWPWWLLSGAWLIEGHQKINPKGSLIATSLAAIIVTCLLWLAYVIYLR